MVGKTEIEDTDLFELHKAVMTQVVVDVYKFAADKEFIKHGESLDEFKAFCFENWKQSLNLVDWARRRQAERHKGAKSKIRNPMRQS